MKTQNTPQTEITESAQNTVAPEVKENKNDNGLWQSVLLGGIPGILIGAGGTIAVEAIADPHITEIPEGPGSGVNQETPVVLVAHSVNDDMTFEEAFAAARAEVGPGGAFVWHGQVYGTYRADDPEWLAMSDEERTEHSQLVLSQVHGTHYTPPTHSAETTPESDDNAQEPAPAEDDSNLDVEVHIIGVGQGMAQDGSVVTVGYGSVDDHQANFIDSDGDGEVDTVLIDVNDNGQLDQGEYLDTHGSGITIDELAAASEAYNAAPEESIYDEMPDYTNDADTGSYV